MKRGDGTLPPTGTCIVAGDMNENDPARQLDGIFASFGFTRIPSPAPTAQNSALTVPLTLDHVYARGPYASCTVAVPYEIQLGAPWAAGSRVGSDHVPVLIDLTF